MYTHVADRKVSANPSGKREGERVEQCQGGGNVDFCVGGGQRHPARNLRERKNHAQCL